MSFLHDYTHVHMYGNYQKDLCIQGPDPPEAMNLQCAFSVENTRQLTFIIEPPSVDQNWNKYDVTCSCGRGPWQPVYSSGMSAVHDCCFPVRSYEYGSVVFQLHVLCMDIATFCSRKATYVHCTSAYL